MNELVEFIRARLAEDQQAALTTTPVPVAGEWRAVRDKHAEDDAPLALVQGQDEYGPPYDDYSWGVPVIALAAGWEDEAEANLRHIERWCPARVLRAVVAKRRLLDEYEAHYASVQRIEADYRPISEAPESVKHTHSAGAGALAVLAVLLRATASEWEAHEAYREEWRL